MKHDIRLREQARCAQRDKICRPRTGANKVDLAPDLAQRIIPAPIVLFVDSSITMNAPVALLAT